MVVPAHVRPGRNEPCHCGSGKKYKHCCLAKDESEASASRAAAAGQAAVDTPAEESTAAAAPKRVAKPQATHQPWKGATSRGFVQRSRTPRKAGGS